jgi:hypothetical protein
MTHTTYHFVFMCEVPDLAIHELEDALFEAGCDDALLSIKDTTLSLEFDRDSPSFRDAISSAFRDVARASVELVVRRIGPDDLVSSAEIARRTHMTREAVRLWFSASRRQDFPQNLTHVGKSAVWSWSEVAIWLHSHDHIDQAEVERAELIAALNQAIAQQRHAQHIEEMQWAHNVLDGVQGAGM